MDDFQPDKSMAASCITSFAGLAPIVAFSKTTNRYH